MAYTGKVENLRGIILPTQNAAEAAVVEDLGESTSYSKSRG